MLTIKWVFKEHVRKNTPLNIAADAKNNNRFPKQGYDRVIALD